MTLERYEAKVFDSSGHELWSEVIESENETSARLEAAAEYECQMKDAYEPGHYKAQAMLDAADRLDVKRLP